VSAPRWWEPRFEGTVTRDRLPPGLFDALADRARAAGLRVLSEPPAETLPSYRASAAPPRSLHLEQAEAFVGAWDRLHVWQEGAGTVRFEGSFRRWATHLAFASPVFALVYGGVLTVCCPTGMAVGVAAALLLGFVPMLSRHRRRTKLWVERFVEAEVKRSEQASLATPGVAASEPVEPAMARARVSQAVPVPPVDPALAATAKTARDAFVRHGDRSPEEEVEALEAAARRGDRFG
jgi:hypothetical protein